MLLVSIPLLAAAGCQFKINPHYVAPAADLAGAPSPTQPFDLAPSPPQQQPGLDLALPTGAPDSAAATALDMASPCVRVSEPFSADPKASWTLMGDATFDATQGGLQVTSLNYNVAGSAFYDAALPSGAFDARFSFRMGDGSGADGMAFVVAKADSVGALTPYGNGVPGAGYGLGYLGMNGFAVELDSFMDVGNGDPNNNHVSLVSTSNGAHQMNGAPSGSLRGSGWKTAHIRFTSTHLTVEIDGATAIDGDLPANFALPTSNVFYGFTGAAGAFNDRHVVSGLTLIVGPPVTCF